MLLLLPVARLRMSSGTAAPVPVHQQVARQVLPHPIDIHGGSAVPRSKEGGVKSVLGRALGDRNNGGGRQAAASSAQVIREEV